jgi:hypothetical protein
MLVFVDGSIFGNENKQFKRNKANPADPQKRRLWSADLKRYGYLLFKS